MTALRRAILLSLSACAGPDDVDGPAPGSLLDTGWFDSDDGPSCGGSVVASTPASGSDGHTVHDPLTVVLADASAAPEATVALQTVAGSAVPVSVSVDGATLQVVPGAPLQPATEHVLAVTTCAGQTSIAFTTSDLGAPLAGGPETLRGRTWVLALADATWVAPQGVASLFRANVDAPVLLGVQWATGETIDLIGTQGELAGGALVQDPALESWALPDGTFEQAPRFRAVADRIVLDIQGASVPIEDFELAATFSSDGGRLGDGILRGRLDTRDAASLVQQGGAGGPLAVCAVAESVGLTCEACADGVEACLAADLRDLTGEEVVGLRLVPSAGTED